MSWIKVNEPAYRLVWALAVVSVASVAIWFGTGIGAVEANTQKTAVSKAGASNVSPAATFPGSGTGAIPDRGSAGCGPPAGAPLDITFNVTGLSGAPTDVSLDMTATHSWVGDLDVSLIAPGGAPSFVIFGSTGSTTATGCGSASDLGATYTFNNTGVATWWSLANPFPAGTYRTTTIGDAPSGGTATDLNAAFAGVANPNGTWTLRVTDAGGGDIGSVSAANLTITAGAAVTPIKHVDFDGDGKTDYAQARDITPGATLRENPFIQSKTIREGRVTPPVEGDNLGVAPAPGSNIAWYRHNSGNNTDTVSAFGQPATDFLVPADYDGDGKSDVAIWRGTAASGPGGGYFLIFNSMTSTLTTVDFGITNDNPVVVGDYDGDGKADPAVFRCPSVAGQCNYYYKGSAGGGNITFVPWGFGTSFSIFPAAGDYDGDGKFDFSIQQTNPAIAGQGQFVTRRSSDNGVTYTNWGLNTDIIVPGDYDGDGKYDVAVARSQSGNRVWHILRSSTGTYNGGATFGLSGDFTTPGDYDGDGKTDLAVFRSNADPNNNFFYVYQSGTSTLAIYEYGQQGDYPLANFRVQ